MTGNANRFTQEVLGLRQKIQEGHVNLERCIRIRNEFFKGSNRTLFKNAVSPKNIKVIVGFVYNVLLFLLSKEGNGKEDFEIEDAGAELT